MKGLFVVLGNSFSGAERVLCAYLRKQNDFDFDIFLINHDAIVVSQFAGSLGKDRVFASGLNIQLPFMRRNLSLSFWTKISKITTESVNQYLEDNNYNFVYANSTWESTLIGLGKENISFPIFYHVHDMVSSIKSPIRRSILRKGLTNHSPIFVPSLACKQELVNLGIPSSRVLVAYNHIEKNNSIEILTPKKSNGDFKIGFVGAITPRKGLDILVRSIGLLLKKAPNKSIKARIAWHLEDTSYKRKVLDLIDRLSLGSVFSFSFNLNQEEINQLYSESDLIVVPSRKDPFPTVVLEAINQGTIVMGSNIDGIPEMIPCEDLLFKPGDHKELTTKIDNFIDHDMAYRRNLYSLLLNNATNQFSFEKKHDVIWKQISTFVERKDWGTST